MMNEHVLHLASIANVGTPVDRAEAHRRADGIGTAAGEIEPR